MSNKLTRSGLAFATTVVLALTGLVAAVPANAAVTMTDLAPAAGSTYESINQSGVVIATGVDEDTEGTLKWQINSANSNYTTGQILDLIDAGSLQIVVEHGLGVYDYGYEEGFFVSYLEDTVNTLGHTVDLQGGSIVVTAFEPNSDYENDAVEDADEDSSFTATNETTAYLSLASDDDVNLNDIKLNVRSFIDFNSNNEVSSGEPRSAEAAVTLYDVRTITSVTTVETANVNEDLVTKTVLNKPAINTWFVSTLGQNGRVVGAHYETTSNTLAGAWERKDNYSPVFSSSFANDASNIEDGIEGNFPLFAESANNVSLNGETSTNYSSRAWFSDTDAAGDVAGASADFVKWLSPRSATAAVFAGSNNLVDGVVAEVVKGDNILSSEGTVYVRTGTKTGVVTGQITDGGVDLLASNVRVRATFSHDSLDEDSVVTVTGVTGEINFEDGGELVAFGRTDAKGVVSFTYNNSGAEDEDSFDVTFEVLNSAGVWVSAGNSSLDFEWENAALDTFTVSDNALSGGSITLEYEAADQYGVGISTVGTRSEDALQVTLVGLDDNESTLDKTALVPSTKALVNGKASFTFANYAATDSFVYVVGMLHTAAKDADDLTTAGDADSLDREVTQVFKNDATRAVESVENEYTNVVSYSNFRAGNYDGTDEDFIEFVDDYGVYAGNDEDGERQIIVGSVETANGNGAALQTVTISAPGMLFAAYNASGDWTFGIGSVTTETDVDGNFEVDVYSQIHAPAGKAITITSGGKSFTTTLKTFMNEDIDDEDFWNGTAWVDAGVITSNWTSVTGNAPSNNTIYNITVTAKDVWGNILSGAGIYIDGEDMYGVIEGDLEDAEVDGTPITDDKGQVRFTSRAENNQYANRNDSFELDLELDFYDYDDGSTAYDFDFEGAGVFEFGSGKWILEYAGVTGPQARVAAGAKAGVVRVNAFNVKGKTVSVFVSGKLVKTVTSDKAKFLTKVKGVKAGDKRVTVRVGAKRMVSGFITVK